MNKNQINRRVTVAQGYVKKITGKMLDDKPMETGGKIQKNFGRVQVGWGGFKNEFNKHR